MSAAAAMMALMAAPAQAADSSRVHLTGFMRVNSTPVPSPERPAHAGWRTTRLLHLEFAERAPSAPLTLQGTLTLGGERYRVVLNLGNP